MPPAHIHSLPGEDARQILGERRTYETLLEALAGLVRSEEAPDAADAH